MPESMRGQRYRLNSDISAISTATGQPDNRDYSRRRGGSIRVRGLHPRLFSLARGGQVVPHREGTKNHSEWTHVSAVVSESCDSRARINFDDENQQRLQRGAK